MNYRQLDRYADYLRSFPRFSHKDFLKLERVKLLLKKLAHPEKTFKGVQVAGTNGKGSCVAFLEAILKQAGYKVGTFYSPHLVSLTERIRINGKKIPQTRLAKIVTRLKPLVQEIENEINDRLPWFELITAAAVVYFFEENVDIVVFEVGLGGRLDATTPLNLTTKVITNISYDHTRVLGNTISRLTYEKAGIIQKGNSVVTGAENKALKLIKSVCEQQKSSLLIVGEDIKYSVKKINFQGTIIDVKSNLGEFKNLELSLVGRHQARNFACALGVLQILKEKGIQISKEDIKIGAANIKYRGRFEMLERNPLIIIDAAHNLSGIKALITTLKDLEISPENTTFIYGAKNRKKGMAEILKVLSAFSPKIVFPDLSDLENFYAPKQLQKYYPQGNGIHSLQQAVKSAKSKVEKKGAIVVCGSVYLIGEVIRLKSKRKGIEIDLLDDNMVERNKEKLRIKLK